MTYQIISHKTIGTLHLYAEDRVADFVSVWRQAALELGGQFTPGRDATYNDEGEQESPGAGMTIQVRHEDAALVVDHHYTPPATRTRIAAKIKSAPDKFRLSIYRQDLTASVKKALGAQDILLGEEIFDKVFIVQSNHESLCKAWVSPSLREQILSYPTYTYKLDGQGVVVQREGIEDDLTALIHVIEITAALANGWRKLLARLQAAAEALRGNLFVDDDETALDKLRLSWSRDNLPCSVTFANKPPRYPSSDTVTCLNIKHPSPGRPFSLSVQKLPKEAATMPLIKLPDATLQLRGEAPELAEVCSGETLRELQQLSFLGISSDREGVTLWLPGVITELPTLTRACGLLSLFVQSSGAAPYR